MIALREWQLSIHTAVGRIFAAGAMLAIEGQTYNASLSTWFLKVAWNTVNRIVFSGLII
jgi:hypothetical protein